MSSAAQPVEIIPDHRENRSGLLRKPFAFSPGIPFTFSPESCSPSPRNVFHVPAGIAFTLPRNPQLLRKQALLLWHLIPCPAVKETPPTTGLLLFRCAISRFTRRLNS